MQCYGREEKFIQGFVGETSGKETTSKTDIVGAIILKWLFKKWDGGKDWIDVAQDREWWRVPLNAGTFFTSIGPVSFSRALLHEVSLTRHS